MKGKKTDLNIVNKFIDECIDKNISSPDQILSEASNQIKNIDAEINKLLKLKNKKIELLEVMKFFSEFDLKNKFMLIKDHQLAKQICKKIILNENIKNTDSSLLKTLIDFNILTINDNKIILGKEYKNYELFLKK